MKVAQSAPYLMAGEGRLVGDPWQRRSADDASKGTAEQLTDWDPSEDLIFTRTVQFDAAGARADANLPADCPLRLGVVWRSGSARARGVGKMVIVDGDRVDEELHVRIPGRMLSDGVTLATIVALGEGQPRAPITAWRVGSVLWRDDQRVGLTGGSRFPLQSIAFKGWAWPAGAIWRLEWDASELDVPVLGSLCVYLNSDHSAHALLLGRTDDAGAAAIRAAMSHDVARSLIRGALVHDDFTAERRYPPRSVGRTIQGLLNTAFRGQGYQHLREEMRQRPEVFEARLQDSLRLFEGLV